MQTKPEPAADLGRTYPASRTFPETYAARRQAHEAGPPLVLTLDRQPCEENGQAMREIAELAIWRKVEHSVAYMTQHLHQPLRIAKLAHMADVSSSHFFVLFKRWAGFSPIDYFIRLRVQQAERLLAATTMSVKEIAATLGYSDPCYFSRVFKSVRGIGPKGYRRKLAASEQTDGEKGFQLRDEASAHPGRVGAEVGAPAECITSRWETGKKERRNTVCPASQ
jgi:AraC-like DNA-binding protein